MSSSNTKSISECIYMCVRIAVCRYFLPIQCKWQIMIFFPLVNQVFSPEFTTQPFYLRQFHTNSTGFFSTEFWSVSRNAQIQEMNGVFTFWCRVNSEWLWLVSCGLQGPGYPHIVSQFLISSSLFVLFVGKPFQIIFFQMSAYSQIVPCCEFLDH